MIKGSLQGIIAAWAIFGLAGCVMPPQSQTSETVTTMTYGAVTPVYIPPPGTPFRCVDFGAPNSADLYQVPGDSRTRTGTFFGPGATMGARRGDWLLIVTRTGAIGWIYLPHEHPMSQSTEVISCSVHQDAEGRIVFHTKLVGREF